MSRISSTFKKPYSTQNYQVKENASKVPPTMTASVVDGIGRHSKKSISPSRSFDLKSLSKSNSDYDSSQNYIKSLQHQVYVLELENNHLRQQIAKAVEVKPSMDFEAQTALEKFQSLQSRADYLQNEIEKKRSEENRLKKQLEEGINKLKTETSVYGIDHERLLSELIAERSTKDQLKSKIDERDAEILELQKQKLNKQTELTEAEQRVQILRIELDQAIHTSDCIESELSETRSEILRKDAKLRQLDDAYSVKDKYSLHQAHLKELQEELSFTRERLQEMNRLSDEHTAMKTRLSVDIEKLTEENERLTYDCDKIKQQVEEARLARDNRTSERRKQLTTLSEMKDHVESLESEIEHLKEQIEEEKSKAQRLSRQAAKHDEVYSTHLLELDLSKKRANELQLSRQNMSTDVENMQRDQQKLREHIKYLQSLVQQKSEIVDNLEKGIGELERRLDEAEYSRNNDEYYQTLKWSELENMASSLRDHAHKMASSAGLLEA